MNGRLNPRLQRLNGASTHNKGVASSTKLQRHHETAIHPPTKEMGINAMFTDYTLVDVVHLGRHLFIYNAHGTSSIHL